VNNRNLHSYYASQDISVSFRDLKTDEDLSKLEQKRRNFYTDKLGLTANFFNNLLVAEFGPDTGENALCFAKWGAKLCLIEPNRKAHAQISRYFEHYQLGSQLEALSGDTIETFTSNHLFDFINAEGFVASIRPSILWLNAMNRLLTPDGTFLISYFERTGAFLEQSVNVLASLLATSSGCTHKKATHQLMNKKWNSVPHTRPFDAWYMDAMNNPFAKPEYHFDCKTLIGEAQQAGFNLKVSTPLYSDLKAEVDSIAVEEFIDRSRLSYLLGEPLYWRGPINALAEFNTSLDKIIRLMAANIESPEKNSGITIAEILFNIVIELEKNASLWGNSNVVENAAAGIKQVAGLYDACSKGESQSVAQQIEDSEWFEKHWGTPVHFAVFERQR